MARLQKQKDEKHINMSFHKYAHAHPQPLTEYGWVGFQRHDIQSLLSHSAGRVVWVSIHVYSHKA